MSQLARRERAALCDTLLEVGPDAPTLCEGWLAKDLAAHLVVREHRVIAGTGIWLAPMAGRTERAQAELIAQPWEDLVAQVRARPAWWHPARLGGPVETLFDDAEFYVHHEDLRRGDGVPRPRRLDPVDEESLRHTLGGTARLAFRKSPVGVVFASPGQEPRTVHRKDGRQVTLRGETTELVLVAFGRGRAAEVDYEGSPEDIAAFKAAPIGM